MSATLYHKATRLAAYAQRPKVVGHRRNRAPFVSSGPDNHRCFDRDKECRVHVGTKRQHTYAHVIPLPDAVARRVDIPYIRALPAQYNPVLGGID